MNIATTPTFEPGERVLLTRTVHLAGQRLAGPGTVTEVAATHPQRVRVSLDDHLGQQLWVEATDLRRAPTV